MVEFFEDKYNCQDEENKNVIKVLTDEKKVVSEFNQGLKLDFSQIGDAFKQAVNMGCSPDDVVFKNRFSAVVKELVESSLCLWMIGMSS